MHEGPFLSLGQNDEAYIGEMMAATDAYQYLGGRYSAGHAVGSVGFRPRASFKAS
jgi:hypothetical protein